MIRSSILFERGQSLNQIVSQSQPQMENEATGMPLIDHKLTPQESPPAAPLVGIELNPGPPGSSGTSPPKLPSATNNKKSRDSWLSSVGAAVLRFVGGQANQPAVFLPAHTSAPPATPPKRNPPTPPALLILPAVILVDLCESHLSARELCWFGRTSQMIMSQIKNSKIYQQFPFQVWVEWVESKCRVQEVRRSVPSSSGSDEDLSIGRISSLLIQSTDELKQLHLKCTQLPRDNQSNVQLGQRVDWRQPIKDLRQLDFTFMNFPPEAQTERMYLPPFLRTLKLNGGLILKDFVLPDTLERIHFNGVLYPQDLTQIVWPRRMRDMINVRTDRSDHTLILPADLQALSIYSYDGKGLDHVLFPHSLSDLQLRCDLPEFDRIIALGLPPGLRRLSLSLTVNGDVKFGMDFPDTCLRLHLEITVSSKHRHNSDSSSSTIAANQPSHDPVSESNAIQIHLPICIRYLSITSDSLGWCLNQSIVHPRFLLGPNLISLKSPRSMLSHLVWPKHGEDDHIQLQLQPPPHSQLMKSTLHDLILFESYSLGRTAPLLPHELPSNLKLLDLSDQILWKHWPYLKPQQWRGVFPQQLQTVKLYHYKAPLFESFKFPPTITSLSFDECRVQSGWVMIEAQLQPPQRSCLPQLKYLNLGETEHQWIEAWAREFGQISILGRTRVYSESWEFLGTKYFNYKNGSIQECFLSAPKDYQKFASDSSSPYKDNSLNEIMRAYRE